MSVRFCPLVSGSSGNSVFISSKNTKLLIDAGMSGVALQRALSGVGVEADELSGLLITHEHSDHVQGAGIVSRRYNVPVYATPGTWNAMDRSKQIGKIEAHNRHFVYPNEELAIGDFTIKPFDIPHDASQPVGYVFESGDYKAAVATDIGIVTDRIRENLQDLDVLLIESNHDVEMLKNGKYPIHLKKRILGNNGHLSNVSTGQLLCEIFTKRLKHVYLGHLSEENNRPLIAFDTVCRILNSQNVKTNCDGGVRLTIAERFAASAIVELS